MPAPHTQLLAPAVASLAELVESTSAFDGAIGVADGHDLRLVASLRSRFGRRTVAGSNCPPLARAIAAARADWLGPGAAEGLYLPPHSQVFFVPFTVGPLHCAALLAYDLRVVMSAADDAFLRDAFPAPAPALRPVDFDLPLAA